MPRTFPWAVACCLSVLPGHAEDAPRPRVYTNDDLDRVSPYRDQTGVASVPADDAPARGRRPSARTAGAAHDETYWRREAERVGDAVRRVRAQADDLADRIAERRRKPGVLPYSDPQVVSLEKRRAALLERARDAESRLEERARRAGALPGWLR